MARQPAVNIGALIKMTRNALIHVPGLMRQALKVLHLAVTFGTGNFTVNMALVIKQNVFGHIIKLYPGRWRVGVKVFVFLFNPGMVGDNIFMAMQTLLHRRDSRMVGVGHVGVAVLALDLLDPAMHIMAEGDRLLRSNGAIRQLVK
jgi:hypothetical protein